MVFQLVSFLRCVTRFPLNSILAWIPLCVSYGHEWHHHQPSIEDPLSAFAIPESEGQDPTNATQIGFYAETFSFFTPEVRYRWDSQGFYVESNGIPSHDMMVGITAWQQQVPVPQFFYGDNAFTLPLNPQLSESPILFSPDNIDSILMNAIGLAANGVPIFPALNNRGEDTVAIGETDMWGGHCGRADDYHYHGAPIHLTDTVGMENPIGFVLDGFPLYGLLEPDGSEPQALDEYQGHTHDDLGYHYHSSTTYPYINGGIRGVVDATSGQIQPQPSTSPVRDWLQPLQGAAITAFRRTSDLAMELDYVLSDETYTVRWIMDPDTESVTFIFTDPNGDSVQETYTNWEPFLTTEAPTLSLETTSDESVTFRATGEPGIGIRVIQSRTLEQWTLLGYRLLSAQGESSFTLSPEEGGGFIQISGGRVR